MGKLVKILIFLTAFSTSVFSSPSQLFYEKVMSDGENIVHVEPILNIDNELSGLVYTDALNGQIIYDNFEAGQFLTIKLGGKLVKTIHTISENRDSIYLYSLDISWSQSPRIHIITVTNSSYTKREFILPINGIYMGDLTHADMNLLNNKFYVEISYLEFSGDLQSYSADNVSKTFVITKDEFTFEKTHHVRSVREGHLLEELSNDKFYLYEVTSVGYSQMQGYYDFAYLHQKVINESDEFILGATSDTGETFSFFIGNFAPSSPTDELIIHANSDDLLGNYNSDNHIVCYSFTGGSPEELWYNNDVANIDFSYVYKAKDLLVGTVGNDEILMLNYLNGKVSDSSVIDSKLRDIRFFETGSSQSLLNLVGMSGDTLKVFRFDISTEITSSNYNQEIPKTFSLSQNHPNPFNGETRLEFSNSENQYLRLSIFNILGQEIKLLAASKFSSGTFSFYWDGSDDNGISQSSGIYFARLESKISSEMIKLIYLK